MTYEELMQNALEWKRRAEEWEKHSDAWKSLAMSWKEVARGQAAEIREINRDISGLLGDIS